jgi:tetratricopeptide (TPR) repeat protein
MNIKAFMKVWIVCSISLLLIPFAAGQAGRGKGRVTGTVVDESGNPVAAAKVVIEFQGDSALSLDTTTNKKGEWVFIGLGTGQWRISVAADGYIPITQGAFVKQLETNPKIIIALKKAQEIGGGLIKDESSLLLLEKGNKLFNEKSYDEAIQAFREFQEKNPDAYQIHLSIGSCYREKGEYEEAIGEYNKLIEKAPKEASGNEFAAKALAGIGECYLKKEDIEKAQNYFRQSIEMYPNNEFLAYNVGEICFSNQKLDEAIQYFGLAAKIKPDWPEPYYKLGLVYLNNTEYDKAKENFNKFLTLEPSTERSANVKNILDYLDKIKK